MVPDSDELARRTGVWSALLCTVLSLTYVVGQLFEWAGLLGSAGGPESTSTPLGLALLLTPSLLLGPAFLVLLVSLHHRAPPAKRVWSHLGLLFATAYAVLTGLVYFVQLTLIGPRLARGDIAGLEAFIFVPFESFLYAVDILGYTFMSVATLFTAFALRTSGVEGIARRFLIANGLLVPFLVLQMYWHGLIWIAALWAVTFPGAAVSLSWMFRSGPGSRPPAPSGAVAA